MKTFCRKTTMVKHARRTHQANGALVNDGLSDSDDESPATPTAQQHFWPPQPYFPRMQGAYIQPNLHRHHSLSSNVSNVSNSTSEYTHGMQQGSMMQQRLPSQHMYVSEAPGVATMQPSYSVPRHASLPFSDAAMHAAPSMHSSPSSSSVRSPLVDAGYTFQPAHSATHALHNAEAQQQNMAHYNQPAASQPMVPNQHMMAMVQHHQPPAVHEIYSQHHTSGPEVSHVSSFDHGSVPAYHNPMGMNQMPYTQPWGLPLSHGFKVEDQMMPTTRLDDLQRSM